MNLVSPLDLHVVTANASFGVEQGSLPGPPILDNFEAAKRTVYSAPIGDGDGPFTMTAVYRTKAKNAAKQRVALAGTRLANLLNEELK
jgi:hypothetical protein